MRIIANRVWKKHNVLYLSIMINVLILAVLMLLFSPRFDTNDDIAMSNFVDGSRGTYDPHLIFINCLVGYLLKWLYMTFSIIPWYGVLQYAVMLVSLSALTYVMWQRVVHPYCRCAFVVCLVVVSYEGYIWMQFSRTSTIATVAGVIMLLSNIFRDKLSWKQLVCGYILAITGSFYRFEQFMVMTALLSGIGLFFVLRLIGEHDWKKKLVKSISVFAGLFVLVFGFYQWDQNQYSSEEWKDYKEFNYLRAQLWDYGFPSYKENEEQCVELGVDDTTYNLFSRHVMIDSDRVTNDTFRGLIDLRGNKQLDGKLFKGFIRTMLFNVYQIPAFFLALYAGLLWLFCNKRCWRETVTVIYEVLLIGIIYFYLYYQGRYFLNRVDMGLWLAVAMVIFWMLNQKNDDFSLRSGIVSGLILLSVGLYVAYPRFRVNLDDGKFKYQKQFEKIGEDKEHLYMLKVKALNLDWAYGPLDRLPEGVIQNLCPMGGWTCRTASDNEILRRYDVKKPFKEMINSDKIYIIDDDINPTLAYIRKWYSPSAKAEQVKTIGNCPVYKIVT